jgi:alkylated DNA nucleotide flippase Atl1
MHDWTELSWWRVLKNCGPLEKRMATQYSCLENPMNSMKRQKDMTLEDDLLRPIGVP